MDEIVKQNVINELARDIGLLSMNTRLCSKMLRPIVAKYQLSGDITACIAALRERLKHYTEEELSSDDLQNIQDEYEREDEYYQQIIPEDNFAKIRSMMSRKLDVKKHKEQQLEENLHNRKECICFL